MNSPWRFIVVGLLCCLLAGGAAAQQPEAKDVTLKALLAARSLKCDFPVNAFTDWKSGTPKVTAAREDFSLHFDSVDVKARPARLIGNQGAGDLSAFATGVGLHFIEQTGWGNINFTTVFARRAGGGFIAVSSRHVDLLAGPLPSQYHGVCRIWG